MDANGLRFWMLADDKHWPERSNTRWNSGCRALELASFRSLPAIADPTGLFAQANSGNEVLANEQITVNFLIGSVLVLAGVWVGALLPGRQKPAVFESCRDSAGQVIPRCI